MLYRMSYSNVRVGSAVMDTRKLSRARVSKPRGGFPCKGSAVQRRSPQKEWSDLESNQVFACRASTAGRAKTKGLHARVRRARGLLRASFRGWCRCPDGACRLVAGKRAKT